MSSPIASNAFAINALNNLTKMNMAMNKSLSKLSSGYRISQASDGAADLMLSESMRAQIRGYTAAQGNIQQGLSLLNTADGGMQQIMDNVQRIREIAVEASNGTVSNYTAFNNEVTALMANITQISNGTTYGSRVLLDGSLTGPGLNIQWGANSGNTLNIGTVLVDTDAAALGITMNTMASSANATTLLGQADAAVNTISGWLANVGGMQTRLENAYNSAGVAIENYTSAENRIRNVDIAAESANLTRLQILQQAAASAVSQANNIQMTYLKFLQ